MTRNNGERVVDEDTSLSTNQKNVIQLQISVTVEFQLANLRSRETKYESLSSHVGQSGSNGSEASRNGSRNAGL